MRFALILLLLSLFSVTQAQQIIHDKDAELRQVGDFDAIDVSSAVELRLSSGNENTVAVSASSPQHKANIKTEVRGRVLNIRGAGGKPTVYVSVNTLKRLKATGACDVIISGELRYEDLLIELSGASDLKGALSGNALSIDLSGASDVHVSGGNANVNIDASGASHFRGYDFSVDNCRIDASGASDIKITVNKVLNAKVSGASSITYQGTGTISDIKTSGASRVSKRG